MSSGVPCILPYVFRSFLQTLHVNSGESNKFQWQTWLLLYCTKAGILLSEVSVFLPLASVSWVMNRWDLFDPRNELESHTKCFLSSISTSYELGNIWNITSRLRINALLAFCDLCDLSVKLTDREDQNRQFERPSAQIVYVFHVGHTCLHIYTFLNKAPFIVRESWRNSSCHGETTEFWD
jgi:hypothetical protein